METHIKAFNETQKKLQSIILKKTEIKEKIALILRQHELVHPARMAGLQFKTYEDELWDALSEEDFRKIPAKSIYSIAWHLWHSARIEDITANFFITGKPQVLETGRFDKSLGVPFKDTGNSMNLEEITILSSRIRLDILKEYRIEVGRRTRVAIQQLTPEMLDTKVSNEALQAMRDAGAVAGDAEWLLEFWGKKKIAGIVLMPLTRHLMVHINEAKRLIGRRNKIAK
jgi:hypothetical protein